MRACAPSVRARAYLPYLSYVKCVCVCVETERERERARARERASEREREKEREREFPYRGPRASGSAHDSPYPGSCSKQANCQFLNTSPSSPYSNSSPSFPSCCCGYHLLLPCNTQWCGGDVEEGRSRAWYRSDADRRLRRFAREGLCNVTETVTLRSGDIIWKYGVRSF
jgi:hypothetical protein